MAAPRLFLEVSGLLGFFRGNRTPMGMARVQMALLEAAGRHKVEWQWVKGHAGHPENERVDRLAREAIPARR